MAYLKLKLQRKRVFPYARLQLWQNRFKCCGSQICNLLQLLKFSGILAVTHGIQFRPQPHQGYPGQTCCQPLMLRYRGMGCLKPDSVPARLTYQISNSFLTLRLFNQLLNDDSLLLSRPGQFWLMPIVLMRAKRFRDAARATEA